MLKTVPWLFQHQAVCVINCLSSRPPDVYIYRVGPRRDNRYSLSSSTPCFSFRAAPFDYFFVFSIFFRAVPPFPFSFYINYSVTMRAFPSVFAAIALFSAVAQAGKRGLTWPYCKSAIVSELERARTDQTYRQQQAVNRYTFSPSRVITDQPQ